MVDFWKLSFVDYHNNHNVSILHDIFEFSFEPKILQYKYRLCTLRLLMAAEGVFGSKIQADVRYNWGVNIKG